MATRPIFIPTPESIPFVALIDVDFEWYPGFAKTQTQKSIRSLHNSAAQRGISPILEISSKASDPLGVSLSAFNLHLRFDTGKTLSVECAFQGSKVFKDGGPYIDLYDKSSRDAKTDPRLKNSGELTAFSLMGEHFPSKPLTAFYDWLYLRALFDNQEMARQLFSYKGFSDIAFNPEKSINCQARSAALFVALSNNSSIDLEKAVKDKNYYLKLVTGEDVKTPIQLHF
jgi:hypothetical protein